MNVVRLAAELVLRRASLLSPTQRTDILFVWPTTSMHLRLVTSYEKAVRGLWLRHEITRRVRGRRAAQQFRTSWGERDLHAARALIHLACLVAMLVYLYEKEKLRTAAEEQVVTPGVGGQATQEALEHFGVTEALGHSHLSSYREKQRGELDPAAFWEAYAGADEAALLAMERLSGSLLKSADLVVWLRIWPFGAADAIAPKVKAIFRATYRSEAPRRLVKSASDLVRCTDPERASDPDPEEVLTVLDAGRGASLDPGERLVRKETEREVRAALLSQLRDQLTPKQQQVVLEYWQGLEQGYGLSAKLENSFRQRWGADYPRKQRMLHRVGGMHRDLLHAIESFADSRPRRRSR